MREPYYRDMWAFIQSRAWSGQERIGEFGGHTTPIVRTMLERVGCARYEHLAYPTVDLLRASSLPREALDVAILDEVFEHVRNPFLAAANLQRAMRPGGVVLCSTAFLYPRHYVDPDDKQDYFRFTPEGLRAVFEEGWRVLLARTYGSVAFVQYLAEHGWFERGRSGGYTENTVARAQGLLDEPDEDFGVTALLIAEALPSKGWWARLMARP